MPSLAINGIELYYEDCGSGDRAIVFLHGLGSSSRDWEYQTDAFKPHYRLIAPDCRGHGRSGKPRESYSIRQFSTDIAGLVGALHLDSPPVVVGLSMGGMVAFQLAVDHPELVHAMVIVNSGPDYRLTHPAEIWDGIRRLATLELGGMKASAKLVADKMFPGREPAECWQKVYERWQENDKAAYRSAVLAISRWGRGVRQDLHSIRAPTWVVASQFDYKSTAYKEAYARLMPNATLTVIEGAHHAVVMENPDLFNQKLLGFLQRT